MSEKNGAEFDEVLADAMQRVDAPERFAEMVMERASAASVETHISESRCGAPGASAESHISESRCGAPGVVGRGKVIAFPKAPAWMSGAIAAVLVLGCLVGGGVHLRREHERAQATAEYEASMQITNRVLEQTRQQLERSGISLDQQ